MNPVGGFGEIGMGLIRAVRPWDEWIAGWGFDMSQGDPDLSHDNALAKIRTLVGDPALPVEFVSVAPWYVNRAYATEYSRGRIFCGGDAVHRHPPSSGLGSNTSIQDGFNLAWKLAFAVRGDAGLRLLTSYSDERAPVGKQVVERANQSRVDYAPLRACFATSGNNDPVAAGLQKLNAPTREGAAVRAALREALMLKNYEFNAQGTEMNQRYVSSAVIAEEEAGQEHFKRDRALYLQATTRPGAKLPHTWLVNRSGLRVSTLDIAGKGKFSLWTGLSGQAWRGAAESLDAAWLHLVVVGEGDARDPYCSWAELSEIAEAGAILVRPDGYVAWRQSLDVWDVAEATALLRIALRTLLDRPEI
jgi:2,4-dichlorophenol 6-monooxygenase